MIQNHHFAFFSHLIDQIFKIELFDLYCFPQYMHATLFNILFNQDTVQVSILPPNMIVEAKSVMDVSTYRKQHSNLVFYTMNNRKKH